MESINLDNIVVIIPARGGSKGVPRKNVKLLNGKPLIHYTIETAQAIFKNEQILVSTDDQEIKEIAEQKGIKVPFLRPAELATDQAGSYEVLLHALSYIENDGWKPAIIILLQPTSPFRKPQHIKEAIQLFSPSLEMVVSVKETKANPYFALREEDENGYLIKSKESNAKRRQDVPKVYEYNGAIYIINVQQLKAKPIHTFEKVKKYLMDDTSSIDIDTPLDWEFAEFLMNKSHYE